MRHAGAKLLRAENTSTKSVDQTNEERMQEHSPLYTMANSLEDALDNILQIMAEWSGESCGGNVDVRTELDVSARCLTHPPRWLFSHCVRAVIYVRLMRFGCCRR